jgi:hypothetical protein
VGLAVGVTDGLVGDVVGAIVGPYRYNTSSTPFPELLGDD